MSSPVAAATEVSCCTETLAASVAASKVAWAAQASDEVCAALSPSMPMAVALALRSPSTAPAAFETATVPVKPPVVADAVEESAPPLSTTSSASPAWMPVALASAVDLVETLATPSIESPPPRPPDVAVALVVSVPAFVIVSAPLPLCVVVPRVIETPFARNCTSLSGTALVSPSSPSMPIAVALALRSPKLAEDLPCGSSATWRTTFCAVARAEAVAVSSPAFVTSSAPSPASMPLPEAFAVC